MAKTPKLTPTPSNRLASELTRKSPAGKANKPKKGKQGRLAYS